MTGADAIMFTACIAHGNHNNTPLMDRHAEVARMQAKHVVGQIMDEAHAKVDALLGRDRPYWTLALR